MTSRRLRVGSTFSGVGGADLGLERAGFDIAWMCESDEWKRSILAAHWPDVGIFHDVRDVASQDTGNDSRTREDGTAEPDQSKRRRIGWAEIVDGGDIDLLVGGFPCQDLSVAGKRRGFDGERSVLAFEFLRIAESIRPRWLLMENVPGLLSSNRGRDFARLIDEVVGIGYGVAWRVLDARYFGVPQRRRRVFIVARRTDTKHDPRAAAQLALRALWEGSSGDSTPGWPPRQNTPTSPPSGARSGRSVGTHGDADTTITGTLTREYGEQAGQDLTGGGRRHSHIYNATNQYAAWNEDTKAGTLSQRDHKSTNHILIDGGGLAYRKARRAKSVTDDETWVDADHANTLNAFDIGDTRTTHAIVDTASTLQASAGKGAGWRIDAEGAAGGHLIPQVAATLTRGGHPNSNAPGRRKEDDTNLVAVAPTLTQHNLDSRSPQSEEQQRIVGAVHEATMSVRRLTPIECERLMGWPDNWTAPEGIKAPDSKRYAACGDGIVSWVAYWVGQRIQMIEAEDGEANDAAA